MALSPWSHRMHQAGKRASNSPVHVHCGQVEVTVSGDSVKLTAQ
jgi:hypothetical protein